MFGRDTPRFKGGGKKRKRERDRGFENNFQLDSDLEEKESSLYRIRSISGATSLDGESFQILFESTEVWTTNGGCNSVVKAVVSQWLLPLVPDNEVPRSSLPTF